MKSGADRPNRVRLLQVWEIRGRGLRWWNGKGLETQMDRWVETSGGRDVQRKDGSITHITPSSSRASVSSRFYPGDTAPWLDQKCWPPACICSPDLLENVQTLTHTHRSEQERKLSQSTTLKSVVFQSFFELLYLAQQTNRLIKNLTAEEMDKDLCPFITSIIIIKYFSEPFQTFLFWLTKWEKK